MTQMILQTDVAMPQDMPDVTMPILKLIARFVRSATISTYPEYMRQLFGLQQSAIEDKVVQTAMRALMTAVNSNMHIYDAVWSWLVPGTAPIMMPAVLGIPALSETTMTPWEAQKLYGYDRPSEAHMDLRRKQQERVFGKHEAPSDEGLIESEAFFGGMKGVAAG